MPETTFYTTFSNSQLSHLTAKSGFQSGFRSTVSYRFGFNGKENDNEVKGTGNSVDFGARIYDSRLGRWLSVDPLQVKYPDKSPYNFCSNNPIIFVDPDGIKASLDRTTPPITASRGNPKYISLSSVIFIPE